MINRQDAKAANSPAKPLESQRFSWRPGGAFLLLKKTLDLLHLASSRHILCAEAMHQSDFTEQS